MPEQSEETERVEYQSGFEKNVCDNSDMNSVVLKMFSFIKRGLFQVDDAFFYISRHLVAICFRLCSRKNACRKQKFSLKCSSPLGGWAPTFKVLLYLPYKI